MKSSVFLLAVTSCVYGQLEPSSQYNPNFPQQQYPLDNNQNGTYRPNPQIPYGSFPVNGNDYQQQPQSTFYQDSFISDVYGENGNELDPQNTANYYAGLDYEERYRCPPNWIPFRESCYRFTKSLIDRGMKPGKFAKHMRQTL